MTTWLRSLPAGTSTRLALTASWRFQFTERLSRSRHSSRHSALPSRSMPCRRLADAVQLLSVMKGAPVVRMKVTMDGWMWSKRALATAICVALAVRVAGGCPALTCRLQCVPFCVSCASARTLNTLSARLRSALVGEGGTGQRWQRGDRCTKAKRVMKAHRRYDTTPTEKVVCPLVCTRSPAAAALIRNNVNVRLPSNFEYEHKCGESCPRLRAHSQSWSSSPLSLLVPPSHYLPHSLSLSVHWISLSGLLELGRQGCTPPYSKLACFPTCEWLHTEHRLPQCQLSWPNEMQLWSPHFQ